MTDEPTLTHDDWQVIRNSIHRANDAFLLRKHQKSPVFRQQVGRPIGIVETLWNWVVIFIRSMRRK